MTLVLCCCCDARIALSYLIIQNAIQDTQKVQAKEQKKREDNSGNRRPGHCLYGRLREAISFFFELFNCNLSAASLPPWTGCYYATIYFVTSQAPRQQRKERSPRVEHRSFKRPDRTKEPVGRRGLPLPTTSSSPDALSFILMTLPFACATAPCNQIFEGRRRKTCQIPGPQLTARRTLPPGRVATP